MNTLALTDQKLSRNTRATDDTANIRETDARMCSLSKACSPNV